MPWVPEYKEEEEALLKEKINLGLIQDPNPKKNNKKEVNKKKQSQLFQKDEKKEKAEPV